MQWRWREDDSREEEEEEERGLKIYYDVYFIFQSSLYPLLSMLHFFHKKSETNQLDLIKFYLKFRNRLTWIKLKLFFVS